MDETQISITVKPIYIERLVYWILIAALIILLIFSWTRSCNTTEKTTTQQNQQAAPPTTPPANNPPAANNTPAASCTDGIRNQDESDVDCGGSCSLKCSNGKVCKSNADCISNVCTSGTCAASAPAALSGKVDLTLSSVDTQKSPPHTNTFDNSTYYTYKVTGVNYVIKNGLSDDITPHVKVFIKDSVSSVCLNELTVDDANNCGKPYAEFDLATIASGKTLTADTPLPNGEGGYVYQTVGNSYDPSDPNKDSFKVVMYIYDQNGDPIGGKTISSAYLYNPS